jgi:hypothetical protein
MKIKIKTVSEMESAVYDYVYERKRHTVDGDEWGDRLKL